MHRARQQVALAAVRRRRDRSQVRRRRARLSRLGRLGRHSLAHIARRVLLVV